MTRLFIPTAVTVMAVVAGGCAARHAGSYVERSTDFAQYRSYDWAPPDPLPPEDPRLAENAYFQDYVEGAVQRGLAGKGFGDDPVMDPDLLMHYHASVTRRIAVDPFDRARGGACYDQACGVRVMEFEAGMLILDVVDARSGRLVWRGWAGRSIEGVLEQQDWMERQIDEALVRILARLPRRL